PDDRLRLLSSFARAAGAAAGRAAGVSRGWPRSQPGGRAYKPRPQAGRAARVRRGARRHDGDVEPVIIRHDARRRPRLLRSVASSIEAQFPGDAALEPVLRQAAVQLDGGQTGRLDHDLEALGEEPIALQQVAERAYRVAGFVRDAPHGATAFERSQPKLGRRDEPDAMTRIMQQRLHEVWQQPEALGDDASARRQLEQILDD